MIKYSPADSEHIRVYGRTVRREPLPLFWTVSGVEFDTDATECWIDIECDYSSMEAYIRFEVDGVLIQRFMLDKGRREYCIFRSFPEGEVKTVTVRLEGQPYGDDTVRKILVHSIGSDRILQPITPKKHRIEFVGDSLTSGEGLTGSSNIKGWCAGIYGLTGHYGLRVAKHFDAEYSIVSQSGWGVCAGFDNNIYSSVPRIYTKICGLASADTAEDTGVSPEDEWSFEEFIPEVVVVNLGTNDGGACTAGPWRDPETGRTYEMKLEDGEPGIGKAPDRESANRFENAVYDFLGKIREKNPNAYILWVYGMCGDLMAPCINRAIDRYTENTGDDRVSFLPLPECPEEEQAAHMHPGAVNHGNAADTIIRRIEELGLLG